MKIATKYKVVNKDVNTRNQISNVEQAKSFFALKNNYKSSKLSPVSKVDKDAHNG